MKRVLLIATFAASFVVAQALPPTPIDAPDPFADAKKFLGITGDQVTQLISLQVKYSLLTRNKIERVSQVNLEIDQETAKPSPDPMALGVRYLELEVICRELQAAAAAIPSTAVALLTDEQKPRLKQLEDTSKLFPTIAQARSLGLLPGGSLGAVPTQAIIGDYFTSFSPGCRPTIGVLTRPLGTSVPVPTSAPVH